MKYWLENQDMYDTYLKAPMTEKRNFMGSFMANEMKTNKKARVQWFGTETVSTQKEAAHMFEWMSKKAMIDRFGEKKALSKIEHYKKDENKADRVRPDEDTGLDDDDNAEFKVYTDTGGDREV